MGCKFTCGYAIYLFHWSAKTRLLIYIWSHLHSLASMINSRAETEQHDNTIDFLTASVEWRCADWFWYCTISVLARSNIQFSNLKSEHLVFTPPIFEDLSKGTNRADCFYLETPPSGIKRAMEPHVDKIFPVQDRITQRKYVISLSLVFSVQIYKSLGMQSLNGWKSTGNQFFRNFDGVEWKDCPLVAFVILFQT